MSDQLPVVAGFEFAAVHGGVKKRAGALDMGLISCDPPATCAATFTRNLVRAAPVVVSEARARRGKCRAVLVNSGNANACTGESGLRDVETLTAALARGLGDDASHVLMASTGVIGERLPVDAMQRAIPELLLTRRKDGASAFAQSILTTDRFEKVASARGRVGAHEVTVVGCAKGAGMIAPNMATMLAFLWTDADIDKLYLREATQAAVDATFNRAIVDGDMSTNDMVLVLASGAVHSAAAGERAVAAKPLRETGRGGGAAFEEMLRVVMERLARAIVRDGEGATRVVDLSVVGADTQAAAMALARRVAVSPLVKTAIHGCDPNWGRLVAALGSAGVAFDPRSIGIKVGGVRIVKHGVGLGEDAEEKAREVMQMKEYPIELSVGKGSGRADVVTCDLSEEYIRINGSYRS